MFFVNAIRSRLVSLLHPWLEQEPDMDLELGFLHSNLRARNLIFDPSALNRLIDNSSRLSFKRVTVGNLSFRISPWEFPALSIEVSGIDVIFSVSELEGEGCSQASRDSVDLREKEMKAMLALIDPEVFLNLIEKEAVLHMLEFGFGPTWLVWVTELGESDSVAVVVESDKLAVA